MKALKTIGYLCIVGLVAGLACIVGSTATKNEAVHALGSRLWGFSLIIGIPVAIIWESRAKPSMEGTVVTDRSNAASEKKTEPPQARESVPENRKQGTLVPMNSYHQFLVGLARELQTTNMDTIYAHHEAFCAHCGIQFSREALAHLDLFGSSGAFGNFTVIGATQQGNDIRSGRCPHCGSTTMRIVTK